MKFLKTLPLAISAGICGFLLSSCLDDNQPETLYPTLGTVIKEEKLIIDSDSYGVLVPTNPNKFTAAELDKDGQRVMINILANEIEAPLPESEERKVKIMELYKVTTKDINRTDKAGNELYEEFGNNPIQITSASISKEHLNIQYRFKGNNPEIPHRVSLVLRTVCQPDEDGLLPVELRHDAQQDELLHEFWSVTSFRLSGITEYNQKDIKGFKITYHSGANAQAEWVVKK